MSTIVRDSALVNARRVRDQARYIADSLDELKAKQILLNYQKKMVAGKRGKIEDILYTLVPDPFFTNQITKANARSKFLFTEAQGLPEERDQEFLGDCPRMSISGMLVSLRHAVRASDGRARGMPHSPWKARSCSCEGLTPSQGPSQPPESGPSSG